MVLAVKRPCAAVTRTAKESAAAAPAIADLCGSCVIENANYASKSLAAAFAVLSSAKLR